MTLRRWALRGSRPRFKASGTSQRGPVPGCPRFWSRGTPLLVAGYLSERLPDCPPPPPAHANPLPTGGGSRDMRERAGARTGTGRGHCAGPRARGQARASVGVCEGFRPDGQPTTLTRGTCYQYNNCVKQLQKLRQTATTTAQNRCSVVPRQRSRAYARVPAPCAHVPTRRVEGRRGAANTARSHGSFHDLRAQAHQGDRPKPTGENSSPKGRGVQTWQQTSSGESP